MRAKGGTGFPYLVFMDAEGNVLTKQGERSVDGFERTANALGQLKRYEAKAAKGNVKAKKFVFLAKLDLGMLKLDEAKTGLDDVKGLSAKETKHAKQAITNMEAGEIFKKYRRDRMKQAELFLAMKEKGQVPTGFAARYFWSGIMSHAQAAKDAGLYKEALLAMKKALNNDKRYQAIFDRWDTILNALETGKEIPAPPSRRRAARIRKG